MVLFGTFEEIDSFKRTRLEPCTSPEPSEMDRIPHLLGKQMQACPIGYFRCGYDKPSHSRKFIWVYSVREFKSL